MHAILSAHAGTHAKCPAHAKSCLCKTNFWYAFFLLKSIMQYFAKNSNKFFVMNQYKIGRYKFYKTFYDTLHTRHPFFKGAILHK